jgi:hypothetical protein
MYSFLKFIKSKYRILVFWDVAPCSLGVDRRFHHQGDEFIALMMDAVRTSESSVYSDTTQRYIPEDSELHTRSRENLKYHKMKLMQEILLLSH